MHLLKLLKKDKTQIEENINKLKEKKRNSQPLRVKTGVYFKNQKIVLKKVWELIRENVDSQISFGDAKKYLKSIVTFLLTAIMLHLKICMI